MDNTAKNITTGTLLLGKHFDNDHRAARVAAVSDDGRHVCLWHGTRLTWGLLSSALKNYKIADADTGASPLPARPVPPLVVAPTHRPDLASVEPPPVAPETPAAVEPPAPVVEAAPPPAPAPEVEAVAEPVETTLPTEAPEGRVLVLYGGIPVAVSTTPDEEPLIRDLTLAERLGYARPRDIRKIVRRCEAAGDFGAVNWRAVASRQSTGNGGAREFTAEEAWLTEEQTLIVITKSDTPRANGVTREMIRTYMAARRGTLTSQRTPPANDVGAMAAMVSAVVGEVVRSVIPQCIAAVRAELAATAPAPAPQPEPSNVKDMERERAFRDIWKEQAPLYRDDLREFIATQLDRVDLNNEAARASALTSGAINTHFAAWLRTRGTPAPFPRVTFKLLNEITSLYAGRSDDPTRQVRPFRLRAQTAIPGTGRLPRPPSLPLRGRAHDGHHRTQRNRPCCHRCGLWCPSRKTDSR